MTIKILKHGCRHEGKMLPPGTIRELPEIPPRWKGLAEEVKPATKEKK